LLWGISEASPFSPEDLDTIRRLAEISTTSLEKIDAIEEISSQLNELQTLSTVSQSISSVTNLEKLYDVIHQQIIHVMGPVNFFIALYEESTNSIEIPYMDDGNTILAVPPFPLGQGLTSIIIRTRQPLMIVEDTVNRSRALGAIITGDNPARSWLGVPMILRDELIGAIVVQDLENEYRFDENDMRLLTTLSAQVAIAVWNTRLIEIAYKRSLRDQQLYEITNKIRDQIDIKGVLSTTAQELGKALNTRKASIKILSEAIPLATNGNGTGEVRNVEHEK
jgi:GAF domain-containing protein